MVNVMVAFRVQKGVSGSLLECMVFSQKTIETVGGVRVKVYQGPNPTYIYSGLKEMVKTKHCEGKAPSPAKKKHKRLKRYI
jgi:hypothetical protein